MLNRNIPLLASYFRKVLTLNIPKEDVYYYNAVGTHQIIIPEEMIDNDVLFFTIAQITADASDYHDEYSFEIPFMTVLPMSAEHIKQGRFMPILEFFANASINPFKNEYSSKTAYDTTFNTKMGSVYLGSQF